MLPALSMAEASPAVAPKNYEPVYRIPLRVHLERSRRPAPKWKPILEEINSIWLSQAGICFEMEVVRNETPASRGFDLWFENTIPVWNGYYGDPHDMHVRDDPDLRPAEHPAASSAARTAAHELGHALGLEHRQDSDDNLMRSKTYGWQLHPDEIMAAREAAGKFAAENQAKGGCGPIRFVNSP